MTNFEATRSWLAEAAGIRQPSTLERLQRIDWHDYVPTQRQLDATRKQIDSLYRPYTNQLDVTNLIAGLVVGLGVGMAIGYALKGNVAPAARKVRERARDAAKSIEEQLPENLRVTRIDETTARR